jgi:hypothetical protein
MRLPLDTSLSAATAGILCLVTALGVFLHYVRHPNQRGPR